MDNWKKRSCKSPIWDFVCITEISLFYMAQSKVETPSIRLDIGCVFSDDDHRDHFSLTRTPREYKQIQLTHEEVS